MEKVGASNSTNKKCPLDGVMGQPCNCHCAGDVFMKSIGLINRQYFNSNIANTVAVNNEPCTFIVGYTKLSSFINLVIIRN